MPGQPATGHPPHAAAPIGRIVPLRPLTLWRPTYTTGRSICLLLRPATMLQQQSWHTEHNIAPPCCHPQCSTFVLLAAHTTTLAVRDLIAPAEKQFFCQPRSNNCHQHGTHIPNSPLPSPMRQRRQQLPPPQHCQHESNIAPAVDASSNHHHCTKSSSLIAGRISSIMDSF